LHPGALSDEPRVSQLLSDRGFEEVRRFWSMEIVFDGRQAEPAQMPGVEIRALQAGEEPIAYRCLAEAFEDHWGDPLESEDRWMRGHVEADSFDPGLWRMAWRDQRLVGALVAELTAAQAPDLGYIALLGVSPPARGRGIAEALLRSSFVEFQRRGRRGALLLVDSESETGATRLYERVGMRPQPRFSTWEKLIVPAAGAGGRV
jgi:ribosomal protein S18 acetylase RimI-like enzyme